MPAIIFQQDRLRAQTSAQTPHRKATIEPRVSYASDWGKRHFSNQGGPSVLGITTQTATSRIHRFSFFFFFPKYFLSGKTACSNPKHCNLCSLQPWRQPKYINQLNMEESQLKLTGWGISVHSASVRKWQSCWTGHSSCKTATKKISVCLFTFQPLPLIHSLSQCAAHL